MVEKINETKHLFFEEINKTDKPQGSLTKKKREKTPSLQISKE